MGLWEARKIWLRVCKQLRVQRVEVVNGTAPGTRQPCQRALWSRYAERLGYTGATLSRGDISQNGTPVPARCSHCSGGQKAGQAS